jgi:HemK-related putative methylase
VLDRHTNDSDHPAAGVYPVREDTELLRPFAAPRPGETMLDIGTGNGALAIWGAASARLVVATDLNPQALAGLRVRARSASLPILAVRTDLAHGTRRFSRILANPPYLPTPVGAEDPDRWHDLALNGGPDGCRVTSRLFPEFRRHLLPGGVAYLLVSSVQDHDRLHRLALAWRRSSGTVRTVATRQLDGERLEVWELRLRTFASGRGSRSRRGTGAHRPSRAARRSSSSRAPGPGRTRAPGAASVRRRSPPGS